MNKSINTLGLIFFSFFILACKENQKIDSVTIYYVDSDIETPIRVTCGDFEMLFAGSYDTSFITDKKVLRKFDGYLSDFKLSDSTKEIDVRIKAVIDYSYKKKSILCLDKFDNIVLDGRLIRPCKAFAEFIGKQLTK